MSLVIDVSVFVAGALVEDKFHKIASSFLLESRLAGETIYEPVLVLAVVGGVISRVRQDHTPGDVAALRIENFPKTRLRIADGPFARRAARPAARHCLSGADAHYLAVAIEFSAMLDTLDEALLAVKLAGTKIAIHPHQWLRQHIG